MDILTQSLEDTCRSVRSWILEMTTCAGSGHVTSSFSSVELMVGLFASGQFHYDVTNMDNPLNDRLIFSKGHASPLLYSLLAHLGVIPFEELLTLRQSTSRLEGHPMPGLPFTEIPTGSLGQGLGIGVGMALALKRMYEDPPTVYVLLGDSELMEGSNWEAMLLAEHYQLSNLVAVVDINHLGQRGDTVFGKGTKRLESLFRAFGWDAIAIDNGHNIHTVQSVFEEQDNASDHPQAILASTHKGFGVSFLVDQDGWHGKALKGDEYTKAHAELGDGFQAVAIQLPLPLSREKRTPAVYDVYVGEMTDPMATRKAYGEALAVLASEHADIVSLDAEVSNSTHADLVRLHTKGQFFEMYIAEQAMISVAVGMARLGYHPFVSTFAAFLTRAHDQIRMAQYAPYPLTIFGSHCGTSIGEDGASQMGIEDIALFRSLIHSTVLYPSDGISMKACVEISYTNPGITYIRGTRADLPLLYKEGEQFVIGGSKILRQSEHDVCTVVTAGITLHEVLKAYDKLQKDGIAIRVIDLYSIRPIDEATLSQAIKDTGMIVTVEDHVLAGGLGEAVRASVDAGKIYSLGVTKTPHSAKPHEALAYQGIDADGIYTFVTRLCHSREDGNPLKS